MKRRERERERDREHKAKDRDRHRDRCMHGNASLNAPDQSHSPRATSNVDRLQSPIVQRIIKWSQF